MPRFMGNTPSGRAPASELPVSVRLLQNWVRNLIDFSKSVVGHLDNFDKIEAYLAAGENVILLANHQSEADPGAPRHAQGTEGLLLCPTGCLRNLCALLPVHA